MLRRVINPFLLLPLTLSMNTFNVLSSETKNYIDNVLEEKSNIIFVDYQEIEKLVLNNQELKSLQNLVASASFNLSSQIAKRYPSLDFQANGLPKYVAGKKYNSNSPTLKTSQFSANPSLNIKWDVIAPLRGSEIKIAKTNYKIAENNYEIKKKDLIQEAKKQDLSLFPIKKIITHSGRGISGELESIDGLINIGNIEWLLSQGIIIDSDAKKVIDNEETKTNTIIGVSIKEKLLGFILLGDLLRDDSIKTVQNLRENKFKINILSGDRKQTVLALAKKIGCKETEVKWDLLPEMKLKTIENLKINNKVAMIGDGINDVPALASSDLGIAVGSGTQIAKANADVVLMGDQLNGIPYALNLAKKTIRKIKQNLTWAFGYNLLAIPLAAGILFPKYGILLTPSIAALLMAISSITVVINALSLD